MPDPLSALILVLVFQSIFDLIIVFWVILKLGEVLKSLQEARKDIDAIGRLHRSFKGKVQGVHNRFITKISQKFREKEMDTDFSDELIRDD